MLQQERTFTVAVPDDFSILIRCPKCKRQTSQVRFRAELKRELAEDHMPLYCGHCDLTWQGSDNEKNQVRLALLNGLHGQL